MAFGLIIKYQPHKISIPMAKFGKEEVINSLDRIVIREDMVHVWYIDLFKADTIYELYSDALFSILSEEEVSRAGRFVFDMDRIKYVFSHVALRIILGRYLDVDPHRIEFYQNEYGKPFIDGKEKNRLITFNLSHSGEYAVVAVAYNRELGVDIERWCNYRDCESLVTHFFSPYEKRQFGLISREEFSKVFFSVWARKEAFIKAVGQGLSFPLHEFDVTVFPNENPKILRISNGDDANKLWRLFDLYPEGAYSGALAVEGDVLTVMHKYVPYCTILSGSLPGFNMKF